MNDHISGEDLAAYVDGLLDTAKKSEMENHFSSCPACLDELVQIAAIMRSRQGKIPAEFLTKALGEKKRVAKPVLHLRLVFEVAAALVVVVFIGYLFLGNNRFWQTPEQQNPSVVMDRNVRPGDASTAARGGEMASLKLEQRNRADGKKANNDQVQADADHRLADFLASEKRESVIGDKGVPAAKVGYMQPGAPGNKFDESADEKTQPMAKKENSPKKEFKRNVAESEAFNGVQIAFSAKEKQAAKVVEKKAGEAEQNLERQTEPGAGVPLPIEAKAKEGKLKDEETSLKSSVAVRATTGAAQPANAGKKQDDALIRKEIADRKNQPPVRIDGDVGWTDLRNPELFIAWSWFTKDLALELRIDGAGTVVAVIPLGKFDPLLARQAESEAKKLLFSVSKKKSRRARLAMSEKPPNPAELRSPL